MNLRLFGLKDRRTGKTIPDTYFNSKDAAKRVRDTLNNGGTRYVLAYGPDHRKSR